MLKIISPNNFTKERKYIIGIFFKGFLGLEYELLFFVGDYLKNVNVNLDKRLFLDKIPIRFNITNKLEHFHVPLLLSPFGYSTYRGS